MRNLQNFGFVFDLDGTILDDIDLARNIPIIAMQEMGYQNKKSVNKELEEEILNVLGEDGSKLVILRIFLKTAKSFGIPWYKRLLFIKKCQKVYKREISSCPLFPGSMEVFEKIIELGGIIGILTTSSMEEISERFLGREHLLTIFKDNILGRDKVTKMKPNPAGIILLAKKWNIPIENMVMIGDMNIDIQAGKQAGCKTIGVLSGFATKEIMEREKADLIISKISDLLPILPNFTQILFSQIES
ncbi:MAG: HAD family hydrolase [Candidatus Lokiarchaeota archaeon]|nr:HAD family hydrolase [Candidatus Harpocratesius repetitus]